LCEKNKTKNNQRKRKSTKKIIKTYYIQISFRPLNVAEASLPHF